MKVIAANAITVLTFLLCTREMEAGATTIVGDVIIRNENGSIYCDTMICPPEAVACEVIKRNDPNNFSQLIKVRKCLGQNYVVLSQQTITEPNTYYGNVNIHILGGSNVNGRQLTPEEERELEERLSRIGPEIESRLSRIGPEIESRLSRIRPEIESTLSTSLGSLVDGSFARDLKRRIDKDVQDSLRGAFDF